MGIGCIGIDDVNGDIGDMDEMNMGYEIGDWRVVDVVWV